MAFNWSTDISENSIIDNEEFLELEQVVDGIANPVLTNKPYLPTGTPGCSSNNPTTTGLLWGPRGEDIIASEGRADLAAENLDYVRENNWCRGHYADNYATVETTNESDNFTGEQISDFSTDVSGHNETDYTDNLSDKNTNYDSGRNISVCNGVCSYV